MAKFNPSTSWALKDLKKKLKVEKELKKTGMMDAKGRMNPYVMRLASDCAGTADNKKMVILAGIILTLAAIGGGIAYYELQQDHSHSTPAAPNGDIDVQVHQTDLEKIVTVSGNATAGKGLSGVEVEVQKSSSQVFDGAQSISGKAGKYTKDFDATTKEPGTYKAIVKIKDQAGKLKELSKDFVLGDIAPTITSASVDVSKQVISVAYQDKDNAVAAASVAIVKQGTNQAVNGSIYDVFLEEKQSGNFTLSFKDNNLPDGKYDLLVTLKDNSNKNSLEKRVAFELATAPVNQAPVITSWNIQSGVKQPQLYVNASDDVEVKQVTLQLYDKVSGALAFSQNYTNSAKTAAISDKLDLSSVPKGNYTAKVKAIDDQNKVSATLEKMIAIPNSIPQIVGNPLIFFDNATTKWHFKVNATDIDTDGSYIELDIIDKSANQGVYQNKYFNTNNQQSWSGEEEVGLFHGHYRAEFYAIDKTGAKSLVVTKDFDY